MTIWTLKPTPRRVRQSAKLSPPPADVMTRSDGVFVECVHMRQKGTYTVYWHAAEIVPTGEWGGPAMPSCEAAMRWADAYRPLRTKGKSI